MLIKVTAKDIKEGVAGNCSLCPVALALKRASGQDLVKAGSMYIEVGNNSFQTPPEASRFMFRFDTRLSPLPFTFELDI